MVQLAEKTLKELDDDKSKVPDLTDKLAEDESIKT